MSSSSTLVTPIDATFYLACEGFDAELQSELPDATPVVPEGRLLAAPGPVRDVAWAANVWLEPVRIQFESTVDAARTLGDLGPAWSLAPVGLLEPARSLAKRIPRASIEPLTFPATTPLSPPGSWALVAPNEIVASARCTSPFPNGEACFVEDRRGPPSRAYLKLWEALTVLGMRPGYGDRCIDLGSSPGGWTWALQTLDAWVLSVDKAPLDPRIARLPRVECRKASAFSLEPESVGRMDWIVSDIVCYPERLLAMLERWLAVHPNASYVVTIKLQGETDLTPVAPFVEKHGGRVRHLHHNKHEVTWLRAGSTQRPTRRTRGK